MKKSRITALIIGVMIALWNQVINLFPPVTVRSVPPEERRKLSIEEEQKIEDKGECIKCDGSVESKMIEDSYVRWTCPSCGRTYEQYSGYGSIYIMPQENTPSVC